MVSLHYPPLSHAPPLTLTSTQEPNYQELDPESCAFPHSFFRLFTRRGVPRIPTAYPEGKDGPTQIKVISGKSYGVESPVKPYGGCWYFHVIMSKKGSSIFQEIRKCCICVESWRRADHL